MKYNPKVNEEIARMFAHIHPYSPQDLTQGMLKLMVELEGFLAEITGNGSCLFTASRRRAR